MGLPTKNTRLIVVDGVEYRWRVSIGSGWMNINVQVATGDGPRLRALTGGMDWNWGDRRSITPAGVERLIRFALNDGWSPKASNTSWHRINDVDQKVELGPDTNE
ncbi:MAG: hypothetical protein AAF533_22230 [Acidobacteriota bacterium]